jgi:prepilin-type N-terminal cleavage/methylation domain-containing protein
MHAGWRTSQRQGLRRASGFTLIELLVVIAVITILIGAVVVVGTGLLSDARVKNTRVVLQMVQDAMEEFRREPATVLAARQGSAKYRTMYGEYPPDELEVFSEWGLGGTPQDTRRSLAPGGAQLPQFAGQPPGSWTSMKFTSPAAADKIVFEHRDLAAMVTALDLLSGPASVQLNRIPEKNWTDGAIDPGTGQPLQYLNRDSSDAFAPGADYQIRYLVDAWGMPLSYYSRRDWVMGDTVRPSSNHAEWRQASTQMITLLNAGRPIIMSYGPDGKEQLKADAMKDSAEASLHNDWGLWGEPQKIDHPLNEDNVYADDGLAEKLAEGLTTP